MSYRCTDCEQPCETKWQVNEKQTAAKRRSVCCAAPVVVTEVRRS